MKTHHRSCIATFSVLISTVMFPKMYLSFIILVPLLLILWIYIILLVRNSLVPNTSIEVNIIDHKEVLNSASPAKNFTDSSKKSFLKKKIRYHVPKFMLELYEKNKSAGKENAKPDLVRSLIPTQTEKLQENDILEELSENHLLIFDIPTSNTEERFIGAELKILTEVEINSNNELGVKKTLKISSYDDATRTYFSLREIDIHHFNNTWLSFDLTKEVDDILHVNSDKKFLKIVLTISSYFRHQSENNLKLSLLPLQENFDHDYPILLLSYSIEEENGEKQNKALNERRIKHIRKRRSVDEDYEEETNVIWSSDVPKKNLLKKYKRNNCRRRPLYIEFSEIEYDLWIVQPSGYDAYQCQGRCFYPVAEHLSPTKHAIMQALIHSVNPSKASRSCCVPTVLDSISILYVDDKGVLTYRYAYKDMVVLECGCR